MFQLALRIWTGTEMLYPTKFSVMYDPNENKSSVRAFKKNEKIITFDYMLITPFSAINGPIFEKDIIIIDDNEDDLKLVEFDLNTGTYIAKSKNGDIPLTSNHKYEIAGNIFEDTDLINEKNEIIEEKVEEISEELDIDENIKAEISGDESVIEEEISTNESVVEEESNMIKNSSEEPVDINISFISECNDIGIGKYAFTFDVNDVKETYKGSEDNINSKKIDLLGIISALEMLDGKFNVKIFTNSQYVVYPFFKGWIHKWHSSNWYKNDTDRIQNYELWSKLYDYSSQYNISWEFCEELTDEMKECKKIIE